jgi:hypothetical protein
MIWWRRKYTPNPGDVVVCRRGGRWIAGTVTVIERENIGPVNSRFMALLHRRLPCGFVSLIQCEDMRLATDFERQLIQEMEDGIAVYPSKTGLVDRCLPANQWGA